jgi:hypothetical protein
VPASSPDHNNRLTSGLSFIGGGFNQKFDGDCEPPLPTRGKGGLTLEPTTDSLDDQRLGALQLLRTNRL